MGGDSLTTLTETIFCNTSALAVNASAMRQLPEWNSHMAKGRRGQTGFQYLLRSVSRFLNHSASRNLNGGHAMP
jgi:hypothetical protein